MEYSRDEIFEFGQTFRSHVKGKNVMTPTVMSYGKAGEYIYELSKGRGIFSDIIYGITVVHPDKGKQDNLSTCCHTEQEIQEHLNFLRGGLKLIKD